MSYTHLHLLLNHFPIIGTLIGISLLSFAVMKNNNTVRQAALFTIVIMSLIAIPVFLTGEPAEESIENIAGISKALIEEHEEAAQIALWVMLATGAIALGSLILNYMKNKMSNKLAVLSLIIGLLSFGLMARAGYLGGQIRHTEISQSTLQNNQQGPNKTGKEEDND
ncbi:MAG: hypothetical protein ABI723_09170 [Bacteroidia bacterium]